MFPEFIPPDGTRFPRSGDEFKPFFPPSPFRDRLTFLDILRYHAPSSGAFTLLRAVEGELAGAMCFLLRDHDVFVDFLLRNDRFLGTQTPVGSALLGAAQMFAAAHSRPFVRLEAVNEKGLIDWYGAQGFAPEGSIHNDPSWGPLVPMFKPVEPAASGAF